MKFEAETVGVGEEFKRHAGVEPDVGVVVLIVPAFEGDGRLVVQLGHDANPAAGLHQPQEEFELFTRPVEVLHRLGAGEEAVLCLKDFRMIGVMEVVDGTGITCFFEHDRKRRGGAAAEIESSCAGGQFRFNRFGKPCEKRAVTFIVGVIPVKVVTRFFLLRRQMVFPRHKNQIAPRTVPIIACSVPIERFAIMCAKRTVDDAFLCHVTGKSNIFFMKENHFELKGLVVPVPTPFTESGAVDFGAFLAHLDWLAEYGVRNLLVNGTTGEFFSLTQDEQLKLLRTARENWAGMLIFHIGNLVFSQCAENARAAEDADADFLASLPPFYFAGAPADGIVQWFSELAESTALPLILYNFPKHTGNPLTPEILGRVPHYGIKDSAADPSLISATPRYFTGGDRKISAAYAAGAKGFVSASANIDPEPYLRIEREQMPENQAAVNAVNERTSGPFAIVKIKQALAEIIPGYPPHVRLPLF